LVLFASTKYKTSDAKYKAIKDQCFSVADYNARHFLIVDTINIIVVICWIKFRTYKWVTQQKFN